MIIKLKCQFPVGTLQFATCNLQDENGNWQSKILSVSSLSRSIGEDKSYELSGMSIEFSDSDRYFRNMMSGRDRYIAGKTVEILDEFNHLLYRGNVEKWEFKEDSFTLFINDHLLGLEKVIPRTISKELFPGVVDEADGMSIPLIYGALQGDKGAVKCWRIEPGKYLLAGHHCKEVSEVYDKNGNDRSLDFQLANEGTAGTENEFALVNFIGTGSFTDEYIRVDTRGKMENGDLIEHPMHVLENVFAGVSGMNLSDINRDLNWMIMDERDYLFAGVIDQHKTIKEFLVEFAFSFDCDFYISKENQVVITLLNWDNLEANKSLTQKQVTDFQLQEVPETIRNKVTYQYLYHFAEGKYGRTPLYENRESVTNWGEFYNKNEPLNFYYTHDESTAYDVMQRYVFLRKDPLRKAFVEMPLLEFSGVDIADVIELEHPNAIDNGNRKYQVRRVEFDFVSDSVQLECIDITSLTGNLFILGGDDFPETWEQAIADEKRDLYRQYGYLCGDDGHFANGDEGKILY